eukprot:TRINITY_DN11732_c0_g1_i1.p1 TRINITY_DN11732_c0_g1~~TRINITY_DN11732_c0_g1_i1.p1  ORF type:complete len:220 (+),score=34.73 TRINITY_DN11732_c0_g1_i1:255-914(+)
MYLNEPLPNESYYFHTLSTIENVGSSIINSRNDTPSFSSPQIQSHTPYASYYPPSPTENILTPLTSSSSLSPFDSSSSVNWVVEVTHTTPRLPVIFDSTSPIRQVRSRYSHSHRNSSQNHNQTGEFCLNRECYQRVIRNDKLRSPYCCDKCQTREQNLRQERVKANLKEITIKQSILKLASLFIPGLPEVALPFIHEYVDKGLPVNISEVVFKIKNLEN